MQLLSDVGVSQISIGQSIQDIHGVANWFTAPDIYGICLTSTIIVLAKKHIVFPEFLELELDCITVHYYSIKPSYMVCGK